MDSGRIRNHLHKLCSWKSHIGKWIKPLLLFIPFKIFKNFSSHHITVPDFFKALFGCFWRLSHLFFRILISSLTSLIFHFCFGGLILCKGNLFNGLDSEVLIRPQNLHTSYSWVSCTHMYQHLCRTILKRYGKCLYINIKYHSVPNKKKLHDQFVIYLQEAAFYSPR